MSTAAQEITELHSPAAPPEAADIVNTKTPLGWGDIAVTAAIVAAAVYYIYRKLWKKRGQCEGCASQGKAGCSTVSCPSTSANGKSRAG